MSDEPRESYCSHIKQYSKRLNSDDRSALILKHLDTVHSHGAMCIMSFIDRNRSVALTDCPLCYGCAHNVAWAWLSLFWPADVVQSRHIEPYAALMAMLPRLITSRMRDSAFRWLGDLWYEQGSNMLAVPMQVHDSCQFFTDGPDYGLIDRDKKNDT